MMIYIIKTFFAKWRIVLIFSALKIISRLFSRFPQIFVSARYSTIQSVCLNILTRWNSHCVKSVETCHTHTHADIMHVHTHTYIHVYVYIHIKKAMWIVLEKIVLIKNNAYLLIINFLLLYKKLNLPLLKLVQMWQHLSFFAQPLPFSHRLYNPLLILQFQRRTSLVLQGPIKLKWHNFLNFFL